ncbi:hypothetical protein DAPPUDRAFT_265507 [Daphnia pulex]|uniref:Uncharacterized protein n=1 Tax=Daphnia pulex TaxID=6669 RepID=E9HTK1_DAPPU|nr:hypothetical protein DAPPUDRAFT_265507 [Daphnia pulex]|eukprot:EFX64930.1 hypothetical protein DAPPUDRAFT_265507 [Daphnia pulex]
MKEREERLRKEKKKKGSIRVRNLTGQTCSSPKTPYNTYWLTEENDKVPNETKIPRKKYKSKITPKLPKTEDISTATRARGGGAPEGAPPRPRELAVEKLECLSGFEPDYSRMKLECLSGFEPEYSRMKLECLSGFEPEYSRMKLLSSGFEPKNSRMVVSYISASRVTSLMKHSDYRDLNLKTHACCFKHMCVSRHVAYEAQECLSEFETEYSRMVSEDANYLTTN